MLKHLGWQVTRRADASAALASISDDIDLIFSDLIMPRTMNGFELARRARELRPNMPIALTRGYIERVARQAADAGIPLLSKPYGLDALSAAIEAARPR